MYAIAATRASPRWGHLPRAPSVPHLLTNDAKRPETLRGRNRGLSGLLRIVAGRRLVLGAPLKVETRARIPLGLLSELDLLAGPLPRARLSKGETQP